MQSSYNWWPLIAILVTALPVALQTNVVQAQSNAGLVISGVDETQVPASTNTGAVRASSNPHWLEFRGRPILPIGDSVTQGWMEGGTNFDQKGYLDTLAKRGINCVLLWSFYGTSAKSQLADPRVGYDAPELRPWKGSPDDKTIDLTTFNQAYFDRLKQFVDYAENKGILVVITVHDGWPKKEKFANHPFNAALGNGPLTENPHFVELADYDQEMPIVYDSEWTRRQKNQYFQERFADKLCSELRHCSNVIFEMFNEGEWYDQELRRKHEEHFLRFFRLRTVAPLATNVDHVRSKSYEPRANPAVDILSFHKKPWTGHYAAFVNQFRAEPARVIFESEPVPSFGNRESEVTLDILRATVWERALSGAGWVAQNDTSFGWDPKCGMAKFSKERDTAYDYIGHAARFFNQSGVAFWDMAPDGRLSSTGFCLARPGIEYVVYAPNSSAFTLDLSARKGNSFAARWYDPCKGQFLADGKIDGGADNQRFTPPFERDAVLHLKLVATEEFHGPRASSTVEIGHGDDPDVMAAPNGAIHVVFVRESKVFYRCCGPDGKWNAEIEVGPGADPAIALGPDGKPHIALTSSYNGLNCGKISYSCWEENGFSSLRVVAEGHCRKPRIRVDRNGNAVVAFEDRKPDTGRVRCVSVTSAGKVSAITMVGDQDMGGLAIDDNDTRHFIWRPRKGKQLQHTTMTASGDIGQSVPVSPPASDFSDLAVHPWDASVHIVGEAAGAGGILYATRTAGGFWNEARTFKFPEATGVHDADVLNPAIVVDSTGVPYVTFTGAEHFPYFFVIDARGEAGSVQRLDPGGGPTGGKYKNPRVSRAPNGGALVVWSSEGSVFLALVK